MGLPKNVGKVSPISWETRWFVLLGFFEDVRIVGDQYNLTSTSTLGIGTFNGSTLKITRLVETNLPTPMKGVVMSIYWRATSSVGLSGE